MSKTAKILNEDKLVKKALDVGFKMAKLQGLNLPSSSQPIKIKAVYLFLVEVNQITPLPADKLDGANIKKRLALWLHKALPDNDPLK
ncbi:MULTISPECIES: DUF5062 family protein [Vibrio]|uniref:DUF5062 domain-containing protein n=2 Tax=Vibrio genomosp. F10 TaxID=723171 RepID=A0A1B9QZ59_9VIBR|nr:MULTISPECIES: DUF5062 family protein [Vibrio]OCH76063.1 DUF5062 domain-containing protein [Vibrio genomosp. F10]OEE36039.1 DUF5062 domain-containing protein [Vibrio genomosp. F10 str. ZF-129]OEE87131.1 DUF5062 domain-containing protein [Vibrio genomosp. F10 str. 9ZD137]OEE96168.1 DUF5062 domain-containing protein [Vibrio genomosp. F10 str. 9ZC157]OEF09616.1 DUF5062 domain-containing protein [Vibrio genomosp. F10 str. 9ZB36]